MAVEGARGTAMETVRCPGEIDCEIPADLDLAEVLAVPIDVGEVSLVLLAVARDDTTYSVEDLDLLEALSAHIGVATGDFDLES